VSKTSARAGYPHLRAQASCLHEPERRAALDIRAPPIHKLLRHHQFMAKNSRDLIQGTLDMLVLQTLRGGAMHGYAIAVAIGKRSDSELRVEEGALYPALHRLEAAGLLKGEWKLTDTNRRARFYQLTAAGRKHLAAEATNWSRLVAAVSRVMETPA
jgi:PadR family transcriptional regulator PadR